MSRYCTEQMASNRPIGLFDSGVGGTSIWKEIHALLPFEPTLYLADSAHAPYGPKGRDEIIALSIKNTEWLLQQHCKLIVVACNTATTNAIGVLRQRFSVPFIGIEPAIKPAALRSATKKVGILATQGTLSSALFADTAQVHAAGIELIEQDGAGLVPLIEAGRAASEETRQLLQRCLAPMLNKGIDYLVLGCSHYPYLLPLLHQLLPPHVQVLDSGQAVARQTQRVLQEHGLLHPENGTIEHRFYSNGNPIILEGLLQDVPKKTVSRLDF